MAGKPYLFVYVEYDGSIREVTADERAYLETKFHGSDGGRPYIKHTYGQLTPDGRIEGFLYRKAVPFWRRIKPAPRF